MDNREAVLGVEDSEPLPEGERPGISEQNQAAFEVLESVIEQAFAAFVQDAKPLAVLSDDEVKQIREVLTLVLAQFAAGNLAGLQLTAIVGNRDSIDEESDTDMLIVGMSGYCAPRARGLLQASLLQLVSTIPGVQMKREQDRARIVVPGSEGVH